MSASMPFKRVQDMLDDCAKGSSWRFSNHFRMVKFNGKVYPTLPKADTIELGHIRKMIRSLEIDRDCARKYIQIN